MGADLDDLFAAAAATVADLMMDPATVPLAGECRVALTAPTLDALLSDLKDSEPIGNIKGKRCTRG
jgi:SHS2 domain-containing protein